MADLTQTWANVVPDNDAAKIRGDSGEQLTAGQPVYRNAADGRFYRTDADDTEAKAACVGICQNSPTNVQPCAIQTAGDIDLGATLTVGETYVVSAQTGKIAPIGDLGSGDYVTILGVATAADNLKIGLVVSGVQKP